MKYATFNTNGTLTARLIEGIHAIPKSAVKVDEKLWERLISEDDGVWTLVNGAIIKQPLPETAPNIEVVERQRLAAYADAETGSDRFFSEAARMQAMSEPGWEAVREKAIARFREIQEQFPWPDDVPTKP